MRSVSDTASPSPCPRVGPAEGGCTAGLCRVWTGAADLLLAGGSERVGAGVGETGAVGAAGEVAGTDAGTGGLAAGVLFSSRLWMGAGGVSWRVGAAGVLAATGVFDGCAKAEGGFNPPDGGGGSEAESPAAPAGAGAASEGGGGSDAPPDLSDGGAGTRPVMVPPEDDSSNDPDGGGGREAAPEEDGRMAPLSAWRSDVMSGIASSPERAAGEVASLGGATMGDDGGGFNETGWLSLMVTRLAGVVEAAFVEPRLASSTPVSESVCCPPPRRR